MHPQLNGDCLIGPAKFERVTQQVSKQLLQLRGIAQDGGQVVYRYLRPCFTNCQVQIAAAPYL